MQRDIYYQTFIDSNGNSQIDLLSSIFKDFKSYIKPKFVTIFTVDEDTEFSPDLISYKKYGTHDYWWLICDLNNITDPLTELIRGKQLAIPSITDINLFIQSKQSISSSLVREISI